jgi:hypothetical protein
MNDRSAPARRPQPEGNEMAVQIELGQGALIFAEMQEFGSFGVAAQYYIRRSLDVAFDPERALDRWARSVDEADSIDAQIHVYRLLPVVRDSIPVGGAMAAADALLFPLITLSVFDLSGGGLATFSQYRFLYERLLGADIRPWLPSAFAAAAAFPHLMPHRSQALLASLGDLTDRWSSREPAFYPAWLAG